VISIKELNPHDYPIKEGSTIEKNLAILFQRLMELQDATELAFKITSGSDEKQAELVAAGLTKAVHSKHIAGAAADIADPDGLLADWCLSNPKALEAIGLWVEHPDYTFSETDERKRWVHCQMMAPKSGRRIFVPW
jgi:hypothetical protein